MANPRTARYPELADASWLASRYLTDRLSTAKIARMLGCDHKAVHAALVRHGIPRRGHGSQESADRARARSEALFRVDDRGCHIAVTLSRTHNGYPVGRVTIEGKSVKTSRHRALWQRRFGLLPRHMELDHLCGNPECVNLAHMEPVTRAENRRRRPWNKLDWEKVTKIRMRFSAGESRQALAAAFGVGYETLCRVLRGDTWTEEATG